MEVVVVRLKSHGNRYELACRKRQMEAYVTKGRDQPPADPGAITVDTTIFANAYKRQRATASQLRTAFGDGDDRFALGTLRILQFGELVEDDAKRHERRRTETEAKSQLVKLLHGRLASKWTGCLAEPEEIDTAFGQLLVHPDVDLIAPLSSTPHLAQDTLALAIQCVAGIYQKLDSDLVRFCCRGVILPVDAKDAKHSTTAPSKTSGNEEDTENAEETEEDAAAAAAQEEANLARNAKLIVKAVTLFEEQRPSMLLLTPVTTKEGTTSFSVLYDPAFPETKEWREIAKQRRLKLVPSPEDATVEEMQKFGSLAPPEVQMVEVAEVKDADNRLAAFETMKSSAAGAATADESGKPSKSGKGGKGKQYDDEEEEDERASGGSIYTKMNHKQLQDACKKAGLSTGGKKDAMIERLEAYSETTKVSSAGGKKKKGH